MVMAEAREEFGHEYRGFSYRGLNWRATGYSFRVYAYNPHSPLHPLDMMYYDSAPVDDWRELQSGHGRVAAFNLKSLIDRAYEDPDSFVPTVARAGVVKG
jgi:hypothetical protein